MTEDSNELVEAMNKELKNIAEGKCDWENIEGMTIQEIYEIVKGDLRERGIRTERSIEELKCPACGLTRFKFDKRHYTTYTIDLETGVESVGGLKPLEDLWDDYDEYGPMVCDRCGHSLDERLANEIRSKFY
jgi:hypothetical protein